MRDDDSSEGLHRLWQLKESGAITDREYLQLKADMVAPNGASGSPAPASAKRGPDRGAAIIGIGSLLTIVAMFVFVAFHGPVFPQASPTATNAEVPTDSHANAAGSGNDADAQAASAPKPSGWSYDTVGDEVRGKPVEFASLTSENSVDFGPPYGGGSTLIMIVRKHPEYGQDVAFTISKGQFVCSFEGCTGTINYGRGPVRLRLKESADYNPKTLFASDGLGVINKLKSAQKVVVELPFYQEGDRQFTYNTAGFAWPPPPPDAKGCVKKLAEQAGLHC